MCVFVERAAITQAQAWGHSQARKNKREDANQRKHDFAQAMAL